MAPHLRHTTQSHLAYAPEPEGVALRWRLVVAALVGLALLSFAVRPVCAPDGAPTNESAFGVRHERRGTTWYHCEPWVRRALAD